jgi:transcriptional regulator with XRE-family HTH domain
MLGFGPNLRRLRRNAEMSQMELASCAGISRSYLASIERGLMPKAPEVLQRLAGQFGRDAASLGQRRYTSHSRKALHDPAALRGRTVRLRERSTTGSPAVSCRPSVSRTRNASGLKAKTSNR